jgi:hypothetical protein
MLIDVKGQVTPVSTRSHITYSFDLRQPVRELKIRFSYHPKRLDNLERSKEIILESIGKYSVSENQELDQAKWESFIPLTNLITLSVDDPNGHRGAGHRHDPDQLLYLSENGASPGFVSGPMIEGMWRVTLSLHGIVTDLCSYELQIWKEEEQ